MEPRNIREFKDYCLRRLGSPVIKINVSDDQVDDRINDALKRWHHYHYNGVQRYYLTHLVTEEDVTNRFIPITDPLIIGVIRVLPFSQSTISMFDVRYQVRLNDFYNFNNVSMVHYYMTMTHLALLDFLFNIVPPIRFNEHDRNIYIDAAPEDFNIGQYIVFECYRALDPEEFPRLWSDFFLQEYATALIKRQWGMNLKKFGQVQMTGGVTLNGKEMYDEAVEDIKKLENDLMKNFQEPPDFFLG